MSAKAMGQVWELELPQNEAWVLMAIADHAEHDGTRVFPGAGRIAWKTGYSLRQVKRILQALRERGVLKVEREGGGAEPTRYRIDFTAVPQKEPYRPRTSVVDDTGDKLTPVTKLRHPTGDIAMSPKPSVNHQQKREERTKVERRKPAHRLPADWTPNDKHRELADERSVDCDLEAEKFRDWAESKDERKADWDAAFRNWLRNSRGAPTGGWTPGVIQGGQSTTPAIPDGHQQEQERERAREAALTAWQHQVAARWAALSEEEKAAWKAEVAPSLPDWVKKDPESDRYKRIFRQMVWEAFGASIGLPAPRSA